MIFILVFFDTLNKLQILNTHLLFYFLIIYPIYLSSKILFYVIINFKGIKSIAVLGLIFFNAQAPHKF